MTLNQSRRDFVKKSAASAVCASALLQTIELRAEIVKLPLGLQLYSVRDLLPKDYAGTLKQIGALGYVEGEAAGYYNHSVAEVKQALADAGLKLVSAHYSSDPLHKDFDKILDFNHELGVSYIICAWPGKDPSPPRSNAPANEEGFTLDDWRWNADQFNKFGEKAQAAGIKFGYHNHSMEFHPTEGILPYTELLRLTDPGKVTMELDCGWVIVAGADPVEYLRKYSNRISMLHVKDFKWKDGSPTAKHRVSEEPAVTEMGHGSIDYRPIFEEAAKAHNITHCFVEQEAFTVPPMQSLKIDADYMRSLGAA